MQVRLRESSAAALAASFRYFIPVIAGLSFGALVSGAIVLIPWLYIPTFRVIGLLEGAAQLSLMLFALTFVVAALAARLLRLPSYLEAAVRTALTAVWITPLLIFQEQAPLLTLALWIVLAMDLTRLCAFVGEMAANASAFRASGKSAEDGLDRLSSCSLPARNLSLPDLSFASLTPGIRSFDTLLGAFCLEGALCATLASRPNIARPLELLATLAFVTRGWRMMRESPPPKPMKLNRRVSVGLAAATILTFFAWLPHTGGGLYASVENLMGSMFGRSTQVVKANSVARPQEHVTALIFPGVILYPNKPHPLRLIVPRPSRGEGLSSGSKPLVIPFDGVYWMWRRLDNGLPKTAVLKFGSPERLGFRSTDNSQLWMEAHQILGTTVALDCCRELEMVVENADEYPGTTDVEMVLRNAALPGQPMQSLGLQHVPSRGAIPTAEQTLTFKIPSNTAMNSFDEITVLFRMKWTRGSKSAKVGIQQFVLIPR